MFQHHLVCNNHRAEYGKNGCSCKSRDERMATLEEELGQLRAASVTFDRTTASNAFVFRTSRGWCAGWSGGCLIVVADDLKDVRKIVKAYNKIEQKKQEAYDKWEEDFKKERDVTGLTEEEKDAFYEKLCVEHENEESQYPEGDPIEADIRKKDDLSYKDFWVLNTSFELYKPQPKGIVFNVVHTG